MPPRPPLTHFLCIPLVTESSRAKLQASIQHFTSDVTSAVNPNHTSTEGNSSSSTNLSAPDATDPTPIFHPSAIRPLTTLHLTLGVMSLPTPTRLMAATNLLSNIDLSNLLSLATSPTEPSSRPSPQTLNTDTNTHLSIPPPPPPPPLTLSLHSLHPLPTAQNASILYAKPHDVTGRLYPFCTALRSLFEEAGFILAEKRELLLHCTIVNTVYTRDGGRRGRGHGRGGRNRRDRGQGKFDAREVVEKYDGFEWMRDCRVERVGICEMGPREVEGEVRYVEVAGREMP